MKPGEKEAKKNYRPEHKVRGRARRRTERRVNGSRAMALQCGAKKK